MESKVMFFVVLTVAVVATALPSPTGYKNPPMPYAFNYGVNDPYRGTDFNQNEKSDGKTVKGSYSVQLPDGRKQIVNYRADHDVGYVAEVSYEGQAKYPSKGAPAITFPPSKGGGYH